MYGSREEREREKGKEKWVSDYSTLMMLSKNIDFKLHIHYLTYVRLNPNTSHTNLHTMKTPLMKSTHPVTLICRCD